MKDYCTKQSHEDMMPIGQYETNAVISRYKIAAACVIKGGKSGDDPLVESIMLLVLGEPSFSLAVPLLPNAADILSGIKIDSEGDGMAGSIDRMRALIYDYSSGRYADRYADTDVLVDLRFETFPLQDTMSASYDRLLPVWRTMDNIQRQEHMQGWSLQMQAFGKTAYDSLYSEITGLHEQQEEYLQPGSYILDQNYPNPFNPDTRIEYKIARQNTVNLTVYTALGQKVRILVNRRQEAGIHKVIFDAGDLANGIYYYRLQVGTFVQTRKMVLLR